jgi:tRNA (guanine37-N1)-methyltransferase
MAGGERVIRFHVVTIFPEVFPGTLGVGVVGRAIAASDVELQVHDLREHTEGRHRQVDDEPFGGGAGMVLKPEPLIRAVRAVRETEPEVRCILLSPQGRRFDQGVARELAAEQSVLLVCGRYQGVDQRARDEIGEELSVGDYVLSGGEVAAMAVIEATARLVPGVVGSPESLGDETFSDGADGGFEAPLYTRPADFEGRSVPAVLREGNHAAIAAWRRDESSRRTGLRRPDLIRSGPRPGGTT